MPNTRSWSGGTVCFGRVHSIRGGRVELAAPAPKDQSAADQERQNANNCPASDCPVDSLPIRREDRGGNIGAYRVQAEQKERNARQQIGRSVEIASKFHVLILARRENGGKAMPRGIGE